MFVGKVVGTVWSSVKWPGITGHKLLLVRPYHLADLLGHPSRSRDSGAEGDAAAQAILPEPPQHVQSEAVVCIDLLDAGVGDDVIVAFGHAARVAAAEPIAEEKRAERSQFSSKIPHLPGAQAQAGTTTPIDAAVVAVVDGFHIVRPGT